MYPCDRVTKKAEKRLAPRNVRTRQRACTSCAMAMAPPKPKMGVDPARSRDIMDDMVNVVRAARFPAPAPPRAPF